jgi:hypothetical protein
LTVIALLAFFRPAGAEETPSFPLHQAAAEGNVERVRGLLGGGAIVDEKDRSEWTPLHWAAIAGKAEAAALLLDRGADPNARGNFDMTPLHWAAMKGRSQLVKLLTRRGARTDAKNIYGMTPLHMAADEQTAKALLDAGAKTDWVDDRGMTPLETARQGLVAKALLQAGADIRHRSHDGSGALDIAVVESLDPLGLSVLTRRAAMRLREQMARVTITLRSVTEHPFVDLVVRVESPAFEVRVTPASIPVLLPGQLTEIRLNLWRRWAVQPGEYPVLFTVSSQGKLVGTFDLRVDTSPGITPEDQGMIKLGKASLRPAPSRWHYIVYAAVPVAVLVAWLVLRRRSRRVK